jgi:hypothetical protein
MRKFGGAHAKEHSETAEQIGAVVTSLEAAVKDLVDA